MAKPASRLGKTCTDLSDLRHRVAKLAGNFDGDVGVAVRQSGCPQMVGHRSREMFPQQSVSKLWVALAIFDAIDRDELDLQRRFALTKNDLTLFNQPLRAAILEKGRINLSVRRLLELQLAHSDNTANGRLLRIVGGSGRIRELLRDKKIASVRFGPGERTLQSRAAGVEWRPEYSLGNAFKQARAAVPIAQRRAALQAYLADPPDGATPAGIVDALVALHERKLLSARSTDDLLAIMRASRTGPRRLKGGIPATWTAAHKTGTGQELAGLATGYNDVALLCAPSGRCYSVAVMIGSTRRSVGDRMTLMQNIARAVSQAEATGSRP